MQVRFESVHKTYRRRDGTEVPALAGVDLAVASSEFVSLVGPSGCGKSTLLLIAAGLLPPTSGRVVFEGDAGGRPRTAVVFQEFALFPWRTVLDNVAFGLEVRGVGRAERLERAAALVRQVGLSGFESRYPHELSGGMRQRVGIARALCVDPAVLLMDEPLSALDAQTRQLLQEDILRLWETTRKTVLYVTHNIQEAVFLSDRVVVMSRRPGRVREVLSVPFPRPRTEALLADPEFGRFCHRIWSSLKEEARAALEETNGDGSPA
ncbi:MAG: ABC transporter ATP-binding protein [Armatimonadota bacterium]|nr:ABC transporter ATP-binding protein [Armatimonadota bacterium]